MHHGGGLPRQLQLVDPGEVPYDVSEIIADNLSKAGSSWGCVSAIDSNLCALGAGGRAALPTSVTSNADKVWVVYLQA